MGYLSWNVWEYEVFILNLKVSQTHLGWVVHDGLRIVGNSVVDGTEFGELADVWAQVLVQDSDVIVSVMSLLLVPHSQGVTNLVDGDTKLQKNVY